MSDNVDVITDEKERYTTWVLLAYPDSAPENWLDLLDELHVPALVSPLHDRDIDGDGLPKKPHWHIIVKFGSKKSFDQVRKWSSFLNGPVPKPAGDLRGAARYLCHLDSPHKALYDVADVKEFGGLDFNEIAAAKSERYQAISEMMDFCQENGITGLYELMDFSRKNKPVWFRYLCDNAAYVMGEYLKSITWSLTH